MILQPSKLAGPLMVLHCGKESRDLLLLCIAVVVSLNATIHFFSINWLEQLNQYSAIVEWTAVFSIVCILIFFGYRYQKNTSMHITNEYLVFNSTLGIQRENHHIPLSDIEAVNITQNWVCRLFKLYNIKWVFNSSSNSNIELLFCDYLTLSKVQKIWPQSESQGITVKDFSFSYALKATLIKPSLQLVKTAGVMMSIFFAVITFISHKIINNHQPNKNINLISFSNVTEISDFFIFTPEAIFSLLICFSVVYLLCAYIGKWLVYFPQQYCVNCTLDNSSLSITRGIFNKESIRIDLKDVKCIEVSARRKSIKLGGTSIKLYFSDSSMKPLEIPFLSFNEINSILLYFDTNKHSIDLLIKKRKQSNLSLKLWFSATIIIVALPVLLWFLLLTPTIGLSYNQIFYVAGILVSISTITYFYARNNGEKLCQNIAAPLSFHPIFLIYRPSEIIRKHEISMGNQVLIKTILPNYSFLILRGKNNQK